MEILKKEVEELIELKKENSFLHHLWNIISRDYKSKGCVESDEVKVWRQSFKLGVAYPIYTFKFNSKNHLIDIEDKLNPAAGLFFALFVLLISIPFWSIFTEPFDWFSDLLLILVGVLIISAALILFYKYYQFEKKEQLKEIFDLLEIEVIDEPEQKEWSLKMILIRLFIYPFSIGLILLSIFLLIPDGLYLHGIVASVIAITTLYADLRILIKNKTTANNV